MQNKEDAIEILKEWYSRKDVLHEIFFTTELSRRETAVLVSKGYVEEKKLKAVRYMRVTGTDGLRYALFRMVQFQSLHLPINLYYSLATYKNGLPVMHPNLAFRKKDIQEWVGKMDKEMVAYDLLIDIDSPSHEELDMLLAKKSAVNVMGLLDKHKIPYNLRFSGMGYHIVVPYYVFKHLGHHFDPDKPEGSIYLFYNDICDKLKDLCSDMVDTNLHDKRRITKVPYSISVYRSGCYVCWPFNSREEFDGHDFKDYKLSPNLSFKGSRGLFRRNNKLFNENEWYKKNTEGLLNG